MFSRSSSVAPDSKQKLTELIMIDAERLRVSGDGSRSPSISLNRRWSNILAQQQVENKRNTSHLPWISTHATARTSSSSSPSSSVYTSALIKQSKQLRNRSMSPTAGPTINIIRQSQSNNNEYFKGRVKSVYEKEPMFKDFLRNLSLTEQSNYENKNLTTLKKRFNKMVQDKHGLDNSSKHDPLIPSRNLYCAYEPKSSYFQQKPKPPPAPQIVPHLHIY